MATLLDFRGNPIRSSDLTQEQAVGTLFSVRNPYDEDVVTGLTPSKLAAILRRAREGDHGEFLSMAADMEKRDPHYFSTLQTRKLAVEELDSFVDAPSEDVEDTKVTDAVRRLVRSEKFRGAVLHIMDAVAKGFSVVEILWARSNDMWWPYGYKWRNPRWFQWDQQTGDFLRLVDGSSEGEELHQYKYIIHRPVITSGLSMAGGLARVVAALHVFKGFAIKSWLTFAEVFGMPIRVGKYAPGATEKEKEELRQAVTNIGSDAAAIIPKTMELVFERANASGNAGSDEFFENLAAWLNKETSKAVLGQTMTVEDGSSLAQARVHAEVRKDLRNADAKQFSTTVNRDLIRPFVDLNFGARRYEEEYPSFGLDVSESEDLSIWIQVLPVLISLGVPVSLNFVQNLFGIPEPQEGEQLLERMQEQASKEGEGSEEEREEKARALVARIKSEAEGTTNMRVFRKWLREVRL